MTKPEKTRLQFLIALLVVLAITLLIGYRMSKPAAASTAPVVEQKTATPLVQSDARIRLDLLGPVAPSDNVGKNNLFQFRTHPAPEPMGPNGMRRGALYPPPPPPSNTARNAPTQPTGPAAPPPIPLKYYGFVKTGPSGKVLIAVLADNAQHFFRTVEGDFVMGRYRVVHINETSVEVEDTEFNHRQVLALEKQ